MLLDTGSCGLREGVSDSLTSLVIHERRHSETLWYIGR